MVSDERFLDLHESPGTEGGDRLDDVLSSAVDAVSAVLSVDAAAIGLLKGSDVTLRAWTGLPDDVARAWRTPHEASLTGLVFETGQPYASSDIAQDKHYSEGRALKQGLRSALVVPLRVGRKPLGCLYLAFRSPHTWTEPEQRIASAFADQVSKSIENILVLERERRQRLRAETLMRVVSAASTSLSLKKVLIQLCQSVADLSVADRCTVFLYNDARKALEPFMSLMGTGVQAPDLWDKFRGTLGKNLPDSLGATEALATGEPLIVEHAPGSGLLADFWVDQFDVKSAVLYPLVHRDKAVGLMVVDAFHDFVAFPAEEIETVGALARQAATVIENTRTLEDERRQRQRSEALMSIISAATSSLDLKRVLIAICSAVTKLTIGDRCSVLLHDRETDTLEPVMSLGPEDPAMWEDFKSFVRVPATSLPGLSEALRTQERIVIGHAPGSPLLPPQIVERFHIKTMAVYPMVARDEVVGALIVDSMHDYVRFPAEELETLTAVAHQAAVIIDNCRLHEQVQAQAVTDSLTGLFNHRHVRERLAQELARADRGGHPMALLMLDIDSLKLINDTQGHQVGDEALKLVAAVLRDVCRSTDIRGRYGGDEFLVILPETTCAKARRVARRVQGEIGRRELRAEHGGALIPVHTSIGVASFPRDGRTIHELVDQADSALYQSKQKGGGRVTTAGAAEADLLPADAAAAAAVQLLVKALGQSEPAVLEHTADVVRHAVALAGAVRLPPAEQDALRKAAWLHDIGRVAVPNSTLLKPGPLNAREWKTVRQHVALGKAIVEGIEPLADAAPLVAVHHERFDGTGYPRGLRGEDIPLAGRILALADAYAAMVRDLPYRPALTTEQAADELRRGAGHQFDPALVNAFLRSLERERRSAA